MTGLSKIAKRLEKSNAILPYGRQDVSEADIEAVISVLKSEFLTQGPIVERFERAVAEQVGAQFATASNSATSSLHLACLALGVGSGDLVWTSPITFVATANCARYCGATVDFIDIDPLTYNISIERLSEKLEKASILNRLPKLIIVVHLAGNSCDMLSLHKLSTQYGFFIIEDASHAIGGKYRDSMIGSCKYSDVTVFSFHPVKIITTGEGGMTLTNNPSLGKRIALFNSHGITRNVNEMTGPSDGPWYYEQIELGYNYRMTDIQAALGLSQLSRLEEFVSRRHALASRYDRLLAGLPLLTPWRDDRDYSGFHLYVVRLKLESKSVTRRQVFEVLRSRGILVNLHYIPVYRQPDFGQFGHVRDDYPESERYYSEALTLPLFPAMTDDDQNRVVSELSEALKG